MNALDRAIAFVAPEWGARRAAARFGIEQLATHAEAVPSRLDSPSQAPGTSADWDLELGRDRRQFVDRVRQLERDNVLACALLDRSVESVVGTGFRYQARSKNKAWCKKAEKLWKTFCRKFADARGIHSLHELVALTFRGYLRDGEAGLVKLKPTPTREGCLRTFESDELGTPSGYTKPGQVDGIDLDSNARPKTFHLFKPNMNVLYSDRRVSGDRLSVPAADVIFVARRTRTGQTRGLTAFNGCFWALDQIKGSIEAVTVSLRMAACLGLIIKKASPVTGSVVPDKNSPSGQRRVMNLTPGGVLQLLPGEDVEQVTPTAPGAFFEGHVRLLMRIAATAFGLPLEVALGDFGPLNLSAARANLQQAIRSWKLLQRIPEHIYNEVLDWKLNEWMESGELEEVDDWEERHWVKPSWIVMDPVTDSQANLLDYDAGFKTLAEIAGERGLSLEELLDQRQHEDQLLKERKLEPVHSTFSRDRIAPAAQGAAGGKPPREGARRAKPQDLAGVRRAVRRELVGAAVRNAG